MAIIYMVQSLNLKYKKMKICHCNGLRKQIYSKLFNQSFQKQTSRSNNAEFYVKYKSLSIFLLEN